MVHLMFALLLSGPLPHPDCQARRSCLGVCMWSWADSKCHDSRVVDLGEWYPRPADFEWSANAYQALPEPWGAYPTEKGP